MRSRSRRSSPARCKPGLARLRPTGDRGDNPPAFRENRHPGVLGNAPEHLDQGGELHPPGSPPAGPAHRTRRRRDCPLQGPPPIRPSPDWAAGTVDVNAVAVSDHAARETTASDQTVRGTTARARGGVQGNHDYTGKYLTSTRAASAGTTRHQQTMPSPNLTEAEARRSFTRSMNASRRTRRAASPAEDERGQECTNIPRPRVSATRRRRTAADGRRQSRRRNHETAGCSTTRCEPRACRRASRESLVPPEAT